MSERKALFISGYMHTHTPLEAIKLLCEESDEDPVLIWEWAVNNKIIIYKGDQENAIWHRRFISHYSQGNNAIAGLAIELRQQKEKDIFQVSPELPEHLGINPIVPILGEHLQLTTVKTEGSLYLLKCPTGIGKTYAVVWQIFKHLKN